MAIKTNILNDYENAFRAGVKPANINPDDLQFRFCRAKAGQPLRLSDDPSRRIVFLVDGQTAVSLIGLSGYNIAGAVGWDPAYTKGKVDAGYHFGVVVFEKRGCKLATWDNVLDLVEQMYPEVAAMIARHRHALRAMTPHTLRDIESRQGWKFLDVDNVGKSDSRFMTVARYQTAQDTPENARAFLYFTVHLKELFRGDGRTQNAAGQVGIEEFIMPDVELSQLGDHRVIPVTVKVPKALVPNRALSSKELPVPAHVDLDNATKWDFEPCLCAIIPGQKGVMQHAEDMRHGYNIAPAAADSFRIAVMPIDCQQDFVHNNGTLYVAGRDGNGAIGDMMRLSRWVYTNMRFITGRR